MRFVGLLLLALAAGCQVVEPPPDPNDPTKVGVLQPEVLRQNLKAASDATNARIAKGEFSEAEGRELLRQYAAKEIGTIDLEHVPVDQAWEYAEVFLAAKEWPLARSALMVALQKPLSEDRRVNDTLRLATAEAHLGDIPRAIDLARTTFDTPDEQAGPILMAVLYEIEPPAKGKGHDPALAKLLEDAITQHQRVRVNRRSNAGRTFLQARPHHIRRAWAEIIRLYEGLGDKKSAAQARERATAMGDGRDFRVR